MPPDIAALYSRARTQGNKYWDFSASRKEVRGQFGQRFVRDPAERGGAAQPAGVPPRQPREPGQGPQLEPQTLPGSMRETLPQPTRETGTRWYALHSVLAPAEVEVVVPAASLPVSRDERPPMVAVFSFAGGVGKTCLVATLGRALSAQGEHVLLADTAPCGLLPLYFGSRESKPGVVRTFSPPGGENDAPVHLLSLEAEHYPGDDGGEHDPLLEELERDGRGASRVLVDVATASRQVARRLLTLHPTILIPILPDMSSVASVRSLETFLFNPGGQSQAFYLLNQFDASSPLHLDVREMLQQQLGDRLLPLVLRRSPAVSEALAEGTTVIDYAPGSAAAEDYMHLAGWLRGFAAPATVAHAGVRWSER